MPAPREVRPRVLNPLRHHLTLISAPGPPFFFRSSSSAQPVRQVLGTLAFRAVDFPLGRDGVGGGNLQQRQRRRRSRSGAHPDYRLRHPKRFPRAFSLTTPVSLSLVRARASPSSVVRLYLASGRAARRFFRAANFSGISSCRAGAGCSRAANFRGGIFKGIRRGGL